MREPSEHLEENMLQILLPGPPTVGVFCTSKKKVAKITRSSSEVVLRTTKHIMIYPNSGLSLEVIALRLAI
jgi:S-methylmethionine-dependent homocysteine/selenocysteine methylase